MKYYELAYTQPYLMTLHPDSEMDVAFLGRPQMTRAFIEYGDTPALGRSVEAERFVIHGMRVPARADGYAPNLEDNPEIEVVQIQFNYLDYDDVAVQSRKCYEVCRRHGKPVLVMEPVKGGSLVNLPDDAKAVLDALHGGSPASYAIRFAAGFPVC